MDLRFDCDDTPFTHPVTRADLIAGLHRLGLQTGDRVLAHVALSSFGQVDGGAQALLDSILAVIGPRGTLMMPYYFVLYEGVFDQRTPPPTYCGVVPQLLRSWPGVLFSFHPSHPVVVLGPDARQLVADHVLVSAVGKNSPVDRIARCGGKVLLLGVNQRVNTTIHTGEAYAGVPYWGQPRPDRPYGRWVLLADGRSTWLPLPETPGDSAGFQKIEPFLVERQLVMITQIGRARCRLMSGQAVIDAVVEFLARDPGGLLCDRVDCTFCLWARRFLTGH